MLVKRNKLLSPYFWSVNKVLFVNLGVEREWDDLPQPDALTLGLVTRPPERTQSADLYPFSLKDSTHHNESEVDILYVDPLEKNISDESIENEQLSKVTDY